MNKVESREPMGKAERKIKQLPSLEKSLFREKLLDVLYDREWCRRNEVNYVNPSVRAAKRALYREIYEKKS